MSKTPQPPSLQSVITPDIKAQLDQFMKGASVPSTSSSSSITEPYNNSGILSSFMDQITANLFHFDRIETRKITRILSYTGRMDKLIDDEELRSMQTQYNIGCLTAFIVAFLVPKKWTSKSLTILSLMLLKTAILDRIFFYRTIVHEANTNIFEDYSQEYRNILTYYYRKKLEKDVNPGVRRKLEEHMKLMEGFTREYDAFQGKRHLL